MLSVVEHAGMRTSIRGRRVLRKPACHSRRRMLESASSDSLYLFEHLFPIGSLQNEYNNFRNIMDFDCPHCGQGLSAVPEDAGIVVDCPQCGKPVQIPAMPKVGVISSHSNVRGPRLRRPPRTLAERIADVRASAHPKVPKPPAVTIAAFLIVAGVFWGVFDILTNTIVPLSDMAIALFVASSCLMLFLAVGINSGFGWCRVLFLVLSVLGLFFPLSR